MSKQATTNIVDETLVIEPLQPRKPRAVIQVSQHWPAWGYLVTALIALFVWLGGTAVQVQTSESWISQTRISDVLQPHFSIFGQLTLFWSGGLTQFQVVAYLFGWSVQAALILFSLGIDLPQHTPGAKRRSALFSWACAGLILINSMGDWYYSANFGFWGQLGFSFALFITTFCFGYVAVWALHRGFRAFTGHH